MSFGEVVLSVVGILAASGITAVVAMLRREVAELRQTMDDLRGRPERRGAANILIAPAVPGVMERLSLHDDRLDTIDSALVAIGKELHPNGGSSARDAIDRQGAALVELRGLLERLVAEKSTP